ncbi:hypothetical protein RB195_013020 [Necator americanus]|uniref:Uncharacterized protein n=1 Tax=Necator americanus TaxID=51031 RepID=A0ABR1DTL6_NECAM
MLDPFMLACILAAVAAIIAIIFYLFSGSDEERDFEKAFGENARKLLSQDREKHRSKVKIAKKKDVKEKKAEPKLDGDLEVESVAPSETVPDSADHAAPSVSTSSVKTASPIEPKVKKHSKKEKEKVYLNTGGLR